MQPDARIDGQIVEFKTMNFTLQNDVQSRDRLLRRPAFPRGEFTVSGELVTYFQNDAMLAAMFGKPHKSSIWQTVKPYLYRTLAYAAILAATMVFFVSGAL